MTHTPGPWRIIDDMGTMDSIGIYGTKQNQLVAEIRDPEYPVSQLVKRGLEIEIMRANARLIAAAPEMFSLLKRVNELTEDPNEDLVDLLTGEIAELVDRLAGRA